MFVWFHGIVVDINDPLQASRVKVRCFGFHSTHEDEIPNEDLPWAFVMLPTTSASISGVGQMPHGLVKGSQVVGFFRDGSEAQHPVVLGTIPSIPPTTDEADAGPGEYDSVLKTAFNDSDGVYPKDEFRGESDVNRLARDHTKSSVYLDKSKNLLENVITANSQPMWSEPLAFISTAYPHNYVMETPGGIVIEFDSTVGYERFDLYHPAGTFIEIDHSGRVIQRIQNDEYHILYGDHNSYVQGNHNLTVDKSQTIRIKDQMDIEIVDGNINIKILSGSANITVEKDVNLTVNGNVNQIINGDLTQNIDGDQRTIIGGNLDIIASGKVSIRGSTIHMN